jgi:5-methylcytosine-specific restriction endonuclease McrA
MNKPTIKDLVMGPPLLCPICERPNYHPSDHHMVPRSRGGKSTETICADCHKSIHACFTNKELEETFHTVEALLTNEMFSGMIRFISKQDPGGRVTTRKSKDRLRRE